MLTHSPSQQTGMWVWSDKRKRRNHKMEGMWALSLTALTSLSTKHESIKRPPYFSYEQLSLQLPTTVTLDHFGQELVGQLSQCPETAVPVPFAFVTNQRNHCPKERSIPEVYKVQEWSNGRGNTLWDQHTDQFEGTSAVSCGHTAPSPPLKAHFHEDWSLCTRR